ncbi:MAG: hypothetical protein HND27_01745 [Bacteroidetes bacterium]|nr:hypothetical protein [Flavobacteriales bacterium]NOG94480.1 hypothetical protein [Bacteroidota bacterium]WKZ75572.1 MAG: hypothetical protein QY303_01505 [Vicingaceae bacterium]MCL4815138.1 hypothetical protein [Flavobacteriales bacterium]CAG0949078.1 hypothetical protein FLAV_00076 [Flavobacteriales bacterium]
MKRLKILIATVIAANNVIAQNETDALRYSFINYNGTARFNAMGGAFGALGGDISALSTNPGTIGIFRKSDFSITPTFHYGDAKSNYNGSTAVDGRLNFNLSNIGIVGVYESSSYDWMNTQFAIGYNRLNNFNGNVAIKGMNINGSSMLDDYITEVNSSGGTFSSDIEKFYPFGANLAYQTYLINPNPNDSMLYTHLLQGRNNIMQEKYITTRGGMGETYLAFGGNYGDKLFIGGSINFQNIRYSEEIYYKETPPENDTLSNLKYWERNDELTTRGWGVNAKFGMIYAFADWLRIGGAAHTPTYFAMSDNWSSNMKATFIDSSNTELTHNSPNGSFDYSLTTPFRAIGSIGFIVGKYGIIGVDYEYVDYSQGRLGDQREFSTSPYGFNQENANIKSFYTAANNIRVGTEWRLDPIRLRAGYQLNGNPYKSVTNRDISSNTLSFGIGIRGEETYFDIGYSLTQYNKEWQLYKSATSSANVAHSAHLISFTLGFKY